MPNKTVQLVGPYVDNNEYVVQTDKSYTLSNDHRFVNVTGPNVTLTMPPNPLIGQTHVVQASGNTAVNIVALEKNLTVPIGTSMVVTWGGGGKWSVGSNGTTPPIPSNLTQTNWYIDPQNETGAASDSNIGSSPLLPLLTFAEAYRRVFGLGTEVFLQQNTTVIFLSSSFSADSININLGLAYGVILTFVNAASTIQASGTITGSTPVNPAVNQDQQLVTSVANWIQFVGVSRIRITNGPRAGYIAWPSKQLAPNTIRTSSFAINSSPTPGFPPTVITEAAPQNGDQFVVEEMGGITIGSIQVAASPVVNLNTPPPPGAIDIPPVILFQNFMTSAENVRGVGDVLIVGVADDTAPVLFFQSCVIAGTVPNASFDNCTIQAQILSGRIRAGQTYANFVGFVTTDKVNGVQFQNNHLIQGGQGFTVQGNLTTFGASNVDGFAVFDSTGDGVSLTPGAVANAPGVVYGNGNANRGLYVQMGGKFISQSGVPTIKGAAGMDFRLGTDSGQERAFNGSTNAYTAPIVTTTWANFIQTIGLGGFDAQAHDPGTDAHLINVGGGGA